MTAKAPGPVDTRLEASAMTDGDLARARAAKFASIAPDLDAALDAQRSVLFQAMSIVALATRLARRGGSQIDGSISANDAGDLCGALDGAYALLDGVAGKLQDSETFLAVQP